MKETRRAAQILALALCCLLAADAGVRAQQGPVQLAEIGREPQPRPITEMNAIAAAGGVFVAAASQVGMNTESWLYFRDDATGATRLIARDVGTYYWCRFRDGLLFMASDPAHGFEPFFSDGTAAGTRVLDLNPGPERSLATWFAWVEHGGMFRANDGIHGWGLWVFDGTNYRRLGGNALALQGAAYDALLGAAQGVVWFMGADAGHGQQVWRADGSDAGTWRVTNQPNTYQSGWLGDGAPVTGGFVFHRGLYQSNVLELWRTDGRQDQEQLFFRTTGPGSQHVRFVRDTYPAAFFRVGDDPTADLWRTDGTAAGTQRVATAASQCVGVDGGVTFRTAAGVFRVDRSGQLVTLMAPLPPSPWVPVGNRVLYTDPVQGGVWLHGQGQHVRVTQRNPPTGKYAPLADGRCVFENQGWDPVMLTDGTTRGTVAISTAVGDVRGGSAPMRFVRLGARTLFRACDSTGCEPWVTEAEGTRRIANLDDGPDDGLDLTLRVQPELAVLTTYRMDEIGIAVSDGTPGGTHQLAQSLGRPPIDMAPSLAALRGDAFAQTAHGLWRIDPRGQRAEQLVDCRVGPGFSHNTLPPVRAGGRLYWIASLPDRQESYLFRSDGTAAGTSTMPWIPVCAGSQYCSAGIVALGARLFVSNAAGNLWTTTGDEGSSVVLRATQPIGDMVPLPDQMLFLGPTLQVARGDTPVVSALPTPPGSTIRSSSLVLRVGERAVWQDARNNMWSADGSPQGTVPVTSGTNMYPWGALSGERVLAWRQSELFAVDVVHDTAQSLAQIIGYPEFAVVRGRIVVSATTAGENYEPWSIPVGPTVETISDPCGPPQADIELITGDPRLGTACRFSVWRAPAGMSLVLLAGPRASPALELDRGCYWLVGQPWIELDAWLSAGSPRRLSVPLPPTPELEGVSLAVQALGWLPDGSHAVSNAQEITLAR